MALPAPVNQPLLVNDTRSIHPIWLKWLTQTQSSAVAGITSLTGDVTGTGPGATATTISALAVTTGKIANLAVTTGKIADDAVTYAKIQNVTGESFLGRVATTSGDVGEVTLSASQLAGRGASGDIAAISLGTNLSMAGTTLNAAGGMASGDLTSVMLLMGG